MRFRQKNAPVAVKIDRPFSVAFIPEPELDDSGRTIWNAHIIGHELDNWTFDYHPVNALRMAEDVLSLLTDTCTYDRAAAGLGHDFSVEVPADDPRAIRTYEPGETRSESYRDDMVGQDTIRCAHCDTAFLRSDAEPIEECHAV